MLKLAITLIILSSFTGYSYANVEDECTTDEGSDTERCRYFFKGYLYGLSESGSMSKKANETFSERAIRTRLGQERKKRSDDIFFPSHCINNDADIVTVAKLLQEEFTKNSAMWAEEKDPIGMALQKVDLCKQ